LRQLSALPFAPNPDSCLDFAHIDVHNSTKIPA